MKFIRTVFILLAGAASALADTNLFSDGTWLIDGATDPGTNASSINITIDKQPAGAFSELKFFYNTGSSNFTQVFSIKGNGTWQPSLPAPSVPGGVFRLMSYWDCSAGLVGPLAVTELGWTTKKADQKGNLELTGKLSNHDSLAGDKLQVTFYPPAADFVRVDLEYFLAATRDICVDQSRQATTEDFRTVTMYSNFISTNDCVNDLARYVRITSRHCFGIYGCFTKKAALCIALTNAPSGYLVKMPRHLGDSRMTLAHTSLLPQNTPGLSVVYRSPHGGQIKPQGLFTPTDDPGAENVEFWGNWTTAKKSYRAKQKISRFRISLQATAPKSPNCDELQTPAIPPP